MLFQTQVLMPSSSYPESFHTTIFRISAIEDIEPDGFPSLDFEPNSFYPLNIVPSVDVEPDGFHSCYIKADNKNEKNKVNLTNILLC